jgi:hypothetical protein
MKTKAQKLLKTKKPISLEELKNKYLNARNDREKSSLLKLIRLRDPKYKG